MRERGIANGWIFAGVGAGAGLTPPLITYLMIHHGWRSSFVVCAIIGFLAWQGTEYDLPAASVTVLRGTLFVPGS